MSVSSFFFLFHLIYNTIRMKSDPKSTIEAGRAILGIGAWWEPLATKLGAPVVPLVE